MIQNSIINDILLINKDKHWTSNDVVRKVKNILKVKKVGHAGTLDPLATGLMILGINQGTKKLNDLLLSTKTYIATIHFNYYTNTNDSEGLIVDYKKEDIDFDEILNKLEELKNNDYYQTPPKYSAIKINGEKAYNLARKNINFKIDPKLVKLIDYKILSYIDHELKIEINVSKGFYVRSFAFDLGLKLNNFANLADLKRIKISNYCIEDSLTIGQLNDIWNK